LCRHALPGKYIELAAALDEKLSARRVGHLNMDGVGAAMMLQFGFPPCVASCATLIARTPGIIHAYQEAFAENKTYQLRSR
jgi:hypothetical protein